MIIVSAWSRQDQCAPADVAGKRHKVGGGGPGTVWSEGICGRAIF
jgi:hypothetical protein